MTHKVLLVIAACTLSALSIAGGPRDSLSGFDEYTFGMSRDQIESLTPIIGEKFDKRYGGVSIFTEDAVTVGGREYNLVFGMQSFGLNQITLTSGVDAEEARCEKIHGGISEQLGEIYGQPDAEKVSSLGTTNFYNFNDGNSIQLTSVAVIGQCIVSVVYKSGKGQASF